MKKVTLCAFGARYSHSNMALHCLRAAVPFDVKVLELSINDRIDSAIEKIVEDKPDAVGFSCYIWSIEHVLKAASSIKKILPDCFVFFGGPEASDGEDLMKRHSFIYMIIRGEGETAFAHFMHRFMQNKSIMSTPSAFIRSGSQILSTPDAPPADLNELAFIYSDLSAFKNKAIYYETSRGCPYRCAYCMSANDNVRFLSLDRVKNELEFFIKSGVMRVKLVDRTFNFPAKRAYDIFSILIKLSEKYPQSTTNFHFEISACLITEEIIDLLKKAKPGLMQFEVGVQSTNEQTLRAINRSHDTQKVLGNTKKLCQLKGILVHTDLIAGLPYEDYESFAKSFDDVYSLGAEQLQLGFLKVLRGSPMHALAEKHGIEYTDYAPYEVLKTKWLSYSELRKLHKIEDMVESLHNSGRFNKTLPLLIKDSAFKFFGSFAEYAESKDYFKRPHSKQTLFELLLGFSGNNKLIKEALIYDWLSGDKNLKFPSGLVPSVPSKDNTREFYVNPENLPHYSHLSTRQINSRCFICEFKLLFSNFATLLFDYSDQKKPTITRIHL